MSQVIQEFLLSPAKIINSLLARIFLLMIVVFVLGISSFVACATLAETHSALNEANTRLSTCEDELTVHLGNLEQLNTKLNELAAEKVQLQKKLNELVAQNTQLTADNENLRQRMKEAQDLLEQYQMIINNLEQELAKQESFAKTGSPPTADTIPLMGFSLLIFNGALAIARVLFSRR